MAPVVTTQIEVPSFRMLKNTALVGIVSTLDFVRFGRWRLWARCAHAGSTANTNAITRHSVGPPAPVT